MTNQKNKLELILPESREEAERMDMEEVANMTDTERIQATIDISQQQLRDNPHLFRKPRFDDKPTRYVLRKKSAWKGFKDYLAKILYK